MGAAGEFNPAKAMTQRGSICHKMTQTTSDGFWNGGNPLNTSLPLFMLQISLMIFTSRILYFLLRPLKQPRVVSDVLAGIILGPSVLGRSKTWAKIVFPPQGENLLRTAATGGMVLFLFLIGVKMDVGTVCKSGKKPLAIALVSMILPLIAATAAAFALLDTIPANIAKGPFLMFVPASISITAFPNLALMLSEHELLNSELGQLALNTSIINDCFGWFFMGLFTALDQGQKKPIKAVWCLLSAAAMIGFAVFVFRPWAKRVNKKIPRGGPVGEGHVVTILLGVLALAFVSDMIGATISDGPLIMGLAMPDGPPLAAVLMDKAEIVVMEVFLPLLFVMSGMTTDLSVILQWKKWAPLVIIMFAGYFAKLAGTMAPAIYCKMDVGNAFVLGLIMSFRGLVEIMTFISWWTGGLLDDESYTVLVLCTTACAAIAAPLVQILYKPFGSSGPLGGRTVRQTRPDAELRVLACVQSQEPVPSIIKILETLDATRETPVCVYVLHLVELLGRAAPLLIPHDTSEDITDPVLKAFVNYEQRMCGFVVVQPFTTVSPYRTMHQDVFKLALDKSVAMVIIPFRRKETAESILSKSDQAVRTMIPVVTAHCPCTVGILIHNNSTTAAEAPALISPPFQRVAVIFWGGPDDREALALATRMAKNEFVGLTVERFVVPQHSRGDERERRLDEEALGDFRVRNARSRAQLVLKETPVKDAAETIDSIKLMGRNHELLIVGRQQLMLRDALTELIECPELGVLGDVFADVETGCSCSVLVVHQHC